MPCALKHYKQYVTVSVTHCQDRQFYFFSSNLYCEIYTANARPLLLTSLFSRAPIPFEGSWKTFENSYNLRCS